MESAVDPTRSQNITVRWREVAGLEQGRTDEGQSLSALVHRQALDDQLVTYIIEGLVVEPEFLAQPPIADPLL